jgi:hypothetical protein
MRIREAVWGAEEWWTGLRLRRKILIVLGVAIAAALLYGAYGVIPRSKSGRWATESSYMTLTLLDRDGRITGSGAVRNDSGAWAFDVIGTATRKHVSLQLKFDDGDEVNYSATMSENDMMYGDLNGGGFNDQALILWRK